MNEPVALVQRGFKEIRELIVIDDQIAFRIHRKRIIREGNGDTT